MSLNEKDIIDICINFEMGLNKLINTILRNINFIEHDIYHESNEEALDKIINLKEFFLKQKNIVQEDFFIIFNYVMGIYKEKTQ